MKRFATRLTVACAVLASLASCSFEYRLNAVFIDGRLSFVAAHDGPGESACLSHFEVTDEAGLLVWEISRSVEAMKRNAHCGPVLPLIYGTAPEGLETRVPVRRPQLDTIYTFRGHATDLLSGAFRLRLRGSRLRVENLDLASAEVERAERAAVERRQRSGQPVVQPTSPEPGAQEH